MTAKPAALWMSPATFSWASGHTEIYSRAHPSNTLARVDAVYFLEIDLKQSKEWDHATPLDVLVAQHEMCLFEAEYDPHWADDGALDCGAIHLLRDDGHYTSLALAPDGWVYYADTSIGADVLSSGRYAPMKTAAAMKIAGASRLSLRV